ncbi:MAG: acetate--CoA ligase family protein [Spirochaetia bacterium]|jgi:succinyl-CoA synthetase beta subunit|nr:acetate--CoA ligase family protein [Spirochaetia bacterium]
MKDMVSSWLKNIRKEGFPDEWESKNLLKKAGVAVPSGRRIMPDEPCLADEFSFPLVLKVCDPAILHKTEHGGVILNVTKERFPAVKNELQERFPSSPLLAEAMCGITGSEFILGGLMDPVFGPAIMAGAGGILTELYEDAAFRLCPCTEDEAVRMLRELRISPVLEGYRGSTLDLYSLAGIVSKVSNLIYAFDGRLNQIDINPLVFSQGVWTALDCVLILKQ